MAAPRRPSGGGLRRAPQDGRLDEINKVGLGPPPVPTRPLWGVGRGLRRGRARQEEEEEGGGCRRSWRPLCPNPSGEGIRPQEEAGFLRGSLSIRCYCPLRRLFAPRASHIARSERAGGRPGADCCEIPFGNVLQQEWGLLFSWRISTSSLLHRALQLFLPGMRSFCYSELTPAFLAFHYSG